MNLRSLAALPIAAGLLSVIVFPVTGLALLRSGQPSSATSDEALPSPSGPLVMADDRTLCRSAFASAGAAP